MRKKDASFASFEEPTIMVVIAYKDNLVLFACREHEAGFPIFHHSDDLRWIDELKNYEKIKEVLPTLVPFFKKVLEVYYDAPANR